MEKDVGVEIREGSGELSREIRWQMTKQDSLLLDLQ
jgi:hypothetical protein